ncbi:hypothetical protein LSUB1_G004744 [Lachnellula subtilissima]|uniref:Uncharacterized protein n=1 Tax=Lachnellula subtilissima TaxID=602034 RepID=A0A8H8U7Z3_9HELO|nr:hypothetical protein LSUB1_G004744 [Lachnellula subtilissima]
MSLTASATAALTSPALTTTFIPTATTCTENRLTMLANRAFEIWMNEPVPVPGSTLTDCYPSQFATSYLLQAGGITQPAFNPLICPVNYSSMGPFTSNYIACCPSGYSLAQPSVSALTDRPAFGGTCYTPLTSGVPVPVTAYGSSGVTATTTFVATVTNAQAYAHVLDGYAFGVAQVASILPTTTSTASVITSTASVITAAASAHTAVSAAGAQDSTVPESDQASPGATHLSKSASIAIGVVVGVVGLALLGLGFCVIRRWKQKGQSEQALTQNMETTSTEVFHQQDGGIYGARDWKQPSEDAPPIPPKEHELHAVSSPVELSALEPNFPQLYGSDPKPNFI